MAETGFVEHIERVKAQWGLFFLSICPPILKTLPVYCILQNEGLRDYFCRVSLYFKGEVCSFNIRSRLPFSSSDLPLPTAHWNYWSAFCVQDWRPPHSPYSLPSPLPARLVPKLWFRESTYKTPSKCQYLLWRRRDKPPRSLSLGQILGRPPPFATILTLILLARPTRGQLCSRTAQTESVNHATQLCHQLLLSTRQCSLWTRYWWRRRPWWPPRHPDKNSY